MKIHFIGIGGIGVSALAKYFLNQGAKVSGSDLVESEIVDDLRKLGAKNPPHPPLKRGVASGHHKENLPPDTGLVIYSAAIEKNNPELKEARKRGIKCQTYAQALGELTKKYFTIAVSGTHGKSTTTAMVALILVKAGLDPTVIVGTKVKWNNESGIMNYGDSGSNFRLGHSRYLVIEADEYDASFLNYWPKIIVLTNIEEDHLDFYRDITHIRKTFKEYLDNLGRRGILVANKDDKNVQKIIKGLKCEVKSYSAKLEVDDLNLKIPGRHNLMNVYAAITVARALGIRDKIAVRALNKFRGTWRRFEYKGEVNGAKIFDDYGHHPTEIKATLQAAREYLENDKRLARLAGASAKRAIGHRRLWCIFQPHQYQRTYQLFDDFAKAFGEADRVVLLPIYSVAGREKQSIKKKVSSKKLALRLMAQGKPFSVVQDRPFNSVQGKQVAYLDSFKKTERYLRKNLKSGDIAIIMGAGDIYKLSEQLIYKK